MAADTSDSLYTRLASALPAQSSFHFYHVSTPPTKSDPLFAPAPGEKQQRTYCESHFLTVSITPPDAAQVLVYAIEILIYTTTSLTTLFVAKADSTGYLAALKAGPPSSRSAIRSLTSTFISWLAENRQRPGVPLVVSLFARAQDQYLFPGSVENPGKHVLDDRQLVKWWCKTLDPVLRDQHHQTLAGEDSDAHAYVIVPGFDKYETTSFFPTSARADPQEALKWHYGHPLRDIAPNPTAPPRCLVPHFPDDPKARYLDELDGEIPDLAISQTFFSPSKRGRGMWKSIKTLEQFWETMAFRQECSSGRLVGFVWLVFTPTISLGRSQNDSFDTQPSASPLEPDLQRTPSIPSHSSIRSPAGRKRRTKLKGPIVPRMPKIKSSSSNTSVVSQPEDSPYYKWPVHGRGQALMDHASYLRVHDLLLRLDFATNDAATKSSCKWIDEVKVLAGLPDTWGKRVTGLHTECSSSTAATGIKSTIPYVSKVIPTTHNTESCRPTNNLSGMVVRKKRKPDIVEPEKESAKVESPSPTVNFLDGGLVRKRPKLG